MINKRGKRVMEETNHRHLKQLIQITRTSQSSSSSHMIKRPYNNRILITKDQEPNLTFTLRQKAK